MRLRSLILAIFLIFTCQAIVLSQKQVDPKDYKPRTLAEVIDLNRDGTVQSFEKSKLEEWQGFIGIDLYHSRVKLQYMGSSRPISEDHKRLIEPWQKLQRVKKKVISLYETEYLFKEGDAEYWIPVQQPLAADLTLRFKPGEFVSLFVVYVGAIKPENVSTPSSLFMATAFGK